MVGVVSRRCPLGINPMKEHPFVSFIILIGSVLCRLKMPLPPHGPRPPPPHNQYTGALPTGPPLPAKKRSYPHTGPACIHPTLNAQCPMPAPPSLAPSASGNISRLKHRLEWAPLGCDRISQVEHCKPVSGSVPPAMRSDLYPTYTGARRAGGLDAR